MERSRRNIKQRAPASKFEELKVARAGGKSRLEQYKPEDNDLALYDEIDEVDYQRAKLHDDFVVDDRGEGYVDNGLDDEDDQRYSSEEEDEAEEARRRGKKVKNGGKKGNGVKVSEGAIDRLFRKPAVQVTKKVAVSTEEDADFMASILGELDETITSGSRKLKRDRQTTSESRPAKKRYSSPTPPLRTSSIANRQPIHHASVKTEMPSSPPLQALTLDSDDVGFGGDEGGFMDDAGFMDLRDNDLQEIQPNEKINGAGKANDDSQDDMPVVKKLSAAKPSTGAAKSVNISASKPAPPPKVEVKKEVSPPPEIPDASWRDLDSTLNITSAPSSSSSSKASPDDVLETVNITIKETVEQGDGTVLEIEKTVEKPVANVFWLDYGEFNGILGLFGKVFNKKTQQWISCFVKVEGLERCLYFLPRETNKGIQYCSIS
jgi:DNA polymerase alpha subunit A